MASAPAFSAPRRRFAAATGSALLAAPATAGAPVAPAAPFETRRLPERADVVAPDGSQVRILPRLSGGSMAHFALGPGQTSIAVRHRTVEEIWYFVAGRGEMWREQAGREEIVAVEPGVSVTIPLGTAFQFRNLGEQPLAAVAITMPPWPGDGEAIGTRGPWPARA